MDGTLADTEPLHHQAYIKVLATLGKTITEAEYDKFTGRTDEVICRYLIERDKLSMSVKDLLALKEKVFHDLVRGKLTPLPGVIETLKHLKGLGLKLAVASASTLKDIDTVLTALCIRDYFDAIASGEEVANSKPAPDVFILAAQRLGVAPDRCLAFEDSENGTIAASKAKMYCIAIPCPSTRHQNHSAAALKVSSMEELDLTSILLGSGRS
jgi:HAD superfamily hydrolase (TIGR01509 family)